MEKVKLIERIIDTFTDMGSEDPVDTACSGTITLEEARMYLAERRAMETSDLEPAEWLPREVTPELYMNAYNCYVRKCRYDVTLHRLAQFIMDNELVSFYHEFDGQYISHTDKSIYPVDFLLERMEFPFTSEDLSMLDLITLGQNSPDFNPEQKYCWYDATSHTIRSTNTPFASGLMSAWDFAKWILEDSDRIQDVQDWYMDNTDADYTFRYWGD